MKLLQFIRRPQWSIRYAPQEAARLLEPRPLGIVRAFTSAEAIRLGEVTLIGRRFPEAALTASRRNT